MFRSALEKYDDIIANFSVCARSEKGGWKCDGPITHQKNVEKPILSFNGPSSSEALLGLSGGKFDLRNLLEPWKHNPLSGTYKEIYGDQHTGTICVLDLSDNVICTGSFEYSDVISGQTIEGRDRGFIVGDVTIGYGWRPVSLDTKKAPALKRKSGKYVDVQETKNFGCGLKKSGTIKCWGTIMGHKVRPPKLVFKKMKLGSVFGCGIQTNGKSRVGVTTIMVGKRIFPKGNSNP